VSLFAFCLPAEHRGVQESRGAIERRTTYRRRKCRTETRAPCYDNPLRAPASRPRFTLSLGATIRKGVNRNEIIYVRARGSDTLSNR